MQVCNYTELSPSRVARWEKVRQASITSLAKMTALQYSKLWHASLKKRNPRKTREDNSSDLLQLDQAI